jgi:tetratricopeptide (TPR) repeat protein
MRRTTTTARLARLALLTVTLAGAHVASGAPLFGGLFGQKSDDDEKKGAAHDEDPLALAALLIQGGDLDRALTVLEGIDPETEGLDGARYARLHGHVLLRLKRYDEAYRALDSAVQKGAPGDDVRTERVRAAHGASLHQETVRALDEMGARWRDDAVLTLIRARALRALGDDAQALAALQGAHKRMSGLATPELRALGLEEVRLLAARGLVVEASDRAHAFVTGPGAVRVGVDDGLALFDALLAKEGAREAASMPLVIGFGELLRTRFPDDLRVSLLLARAYADDDKPLSGALVLEPFARKDRAHAIDVAELYRRAGALESALSWNASSEDGLEKLRQRFSILVDARRYEEACALAPRLASRGLLADADVAYALGFAYFATGQLETAERTLTRIDDARRFADATALVASIALCRKDVRTCP